jgi:hypothetical protein
MHLTRSWNAIVAGERPARGSKRRSGQASGHCDEDASALRLALVAGPPSPLKPALPATVVMMPVVPCTPRIRFEVAELLAAANRDSGGEAPIRDGPCRLC